MMAQPKVKISGSLLIIWALCLLILPLRWLFALAAATLVHELGHGIAVLLCGDKITGFSANGNGMCIDARISTRWKELLCILAGPLAGLLVVLLVRHFPRMALCAAVQSGFNLLPVYPLDGGRAVRCFLPEKWCNLLERTVLTLIAGLGLYGFLIWKLSPIPLLCACLMLYGRIRGKIPCKRERLWVQ